MYSSPPKVVWLKRGNAPTHQVEALIRAGQEAIQELLEQPPLHCYRLGEGEYTRIYKSQIRELAKLDIELLSRCILMGKTDWLEAVETFREAISKGE